jgi:hypothetical protein
MTDFTAPCHPKKNLHRLPLGGKATLHNWPSAAVKSRIKMESSSQPVTGHTEFLAEFSWSS